MSRVKRERSWARQRLAFNLDNATPAQGFGLFTETGVGFPAKCVRILGCINPVLEQGHASPSCFLWLGVYQQHTALPTLDASSLQDEQADAEWMWRQVWPLPPTPDALDAPVTYVGLGWSSKDCLLDIPLRGGRGEWLDKSEDLVLMMGLENGGLAGQVGVTVTLLLLIESQ